MESSRSNNAWVARFLPILLLGLSLGCRNEARLSDPVEVLRGRALMVLQMQAAFATSIRLDEIQGEAGAVSQGMGGG